MNINTRDMNFLNYNEQEMNWLKFNGVTVWENWKTLTSEGVPPLTLNKCKNTNMLGYKVYGESKQQTYTGKNLWNSTLKVGCMKFADGQYLNYPGYVCNATPIPVEAGQTYTISANNYDDPERTSTGFVFYNNGTFVSSLITTSLTVTIPTGVNQLYYDFRKQSSASSLSPSDITNVQLEKGSTATSYEPYVGGVKAPNPNYPQEIESVGDKTKNLFNKETAVEGYISATGAITPPGSYEEMASDYIEIDVSKTYTFQVFNATNNYIMLAFYDSNKNYITNSRSTTFATSITVSTIPSTAKYIRVSARQLQQSQVQAQLEVGSTATSYEPYGYRIPVTVSGQNIIDMSDTSYDFDESVSMWASTVFNFTKVKKYFKPNTTYTISYDVECTSVPEYTDYFDNRYGFFLYSGVSGYSSIIMYQYGYLSVGDKNSYILTFTTPANLYDDNSNYRILGYSNLYKNGDTNVTSSMKFSNIQIVEGSYTSQTMPSYQPYVAPRTTNIYLSEPLRKVGDYADYINLETQKVYRNVGHIDLGSLTWSYQSNLSRFRSSAIDNIKIVPSNWMYDLKSDIYGNTLARNYNIGTQAGIGFVWDDRYTDPADLKNAVTGHYLEYALGNQTEESITLPDILLNKGTNIVSVDTTTTPSNMWIKYKGKN